MNLLPESSEAASAETESAGKSVLRTLFPGESEMARRMRAFDWAQSPLGPVDDWPENLCIAIGICLSSRFPMQVWWGQSLTFFYNDAYISFLGPTKHPGALGHSGREAWIELWSTIGPMIDRVFREKEASWSEDIEMRFTRTLLAEEVYATFSFSPIFGTSGEVEGIFCACSETTEKIVGARQAETLRQLGLDTTEARSPIEACVMAGQVLRSNQRDIPCAAIYLTDANGEQAELAASVSSAQIAWRPPPKLSPLPGNADPRSRITALLSGQQTFVDEELQALGWNVVSPNSTVVVAPIRAAARGSIAGFFVSGVSPHRPLDQTYRTFFDLVAGHLSRAIAEAKAREEERRHADELARLNRAKTAFFTDVSQEFCTPLTLMLGPLEEELRERPESRERLEIAQRNGLRLLKLVNTLLDFSRIEAGRVHAAYEATELAPFTAELASVFRAVIELAGMTLRVECPPLPEPVYVDREMWEKIVFNLLSNAFKFTFAGEIAVALRSENGHAILSVRDTGVGIPSEELPRIFERFHRVQSMEARTYEGVGIGLALVQEFVKLHGGEITVESPAGHGSTFTVSIPFGLAHLPKEKVGPVRSQESTAVGPSPFVQEATRWLRAEGEFAEDVSSPAKSEASVLVVDDDADMREYIARLLSRSYRVLLASDGQAALELVRQQPPNLILADVMISHIDGLSLLQAVRADERSRGIPVILLSARAGEETRVAGLRHGADDYLVKPFSARELLARVSTHLKLAEARSVVEEEVRRKRSDLERKVTERTNELTRMIGMLRSSEAEFRAFFELAAVGAVQLDATDGRFIRVNRRLGEMLGYAPGELHGMSFLDLLHPGDRAVGLHHLETVHRGRAREFVFEKRLLRKGGVAIWASVTGATARDEHGRPVRTVAIVQDVTARRYAEESLREQELRLTALFERASIGLSEISLYGKFQKVNGELCRIFGRPREVLRNLGLGEVIHPDDAPAVWRGLAELIGSSRPVSLELRFLRPNGENVWTNTTFTQLSDAKGRAEGVLAVVSDLTERREAEAAQRQSETQYRTLAELVPDLLWQCDAQGQSHWYNRRWLEYTGQSVPDAIRVGWLEPIHAEDRPSAAASFEEARIHADRFRQECRLRHGADGEYRWFLLQMVPVRDESGAISQWFGAATDTHEQRAALDILQAAEERVRLAVDAADMGFWDWDIERGTVQWEARHNRMLGLPPEQREGSYDQFLERVHPDDRAALEAALQQAIRAGETYAAEFRAVWPDGTIRWVAGRGRVFRDRHGQSGRMIGAVLDITERKQAERELHEKQARLEEALGTAEAAGNAKDEFLATLSHELRTPLNPVLMVAAEAAADPALSDDVRSTFQIVRKNVELEARLIDDLLDLTRITRGKMILDRRIVDVHSVLRDAVETILPDLRSKQIELSTTLNATSAEVDADPVRLQQIFWNILRNAVKFTAQLGHINVVSENGPSPGHIQVRITDNGMGMTPEELGRIFDAFAQGEHAAHRPGMHQFGGLGLGLAISQRLAEMQGGKIRAESAGRGHGATFVVELPITSPAARVAPTETFLDQPWHLQAPLSFRILLVEDHDSTRNALARLLERRHHRVAPASLGEEAIKLIRAERFDVLISDLGLPDLDGCSLLLKLREIQPDLPGIALSGWGMEEDIRRSCEAGFAEHLVKPVAVHKLEAAVERVLNTRNENVSS